MYFESLNEILASWVCILNIVMFEFQIQILFFLFKPTFLTLVCNSNSYIQVCPTKFTFVKIKSRENFGRISQIFPRRFDPF
jgi:hypothetical protein